MNPIVKNRHADALLKLMLLSAILHMAVLVVYFVLYADISHLNFFKIIAIDLFFPQVTRTNFTDIYSLLVAFGLYMCIYFFFTRRNTVRTR